MTLKELCNLYKACNQDLVSCANYRSQYMHEKKDEQYEDLEVSDLDGLRSFLLCDTLAIYKYLGGSSIDLDCYCNKEDNDLYISLKSNPFNSDIDKLFDNMLINSIEPFKSFGVACSTFNTAV